MLVLARKTGQSIVLGGSVEVTIVEVRGDHVRLGIVAPRSVVIKRRELLEREARDGDASVEDSDPASTSPDA